jgi:ABC-type transport system involved in Fe-S cluster assembly fused permease/ATPase subunit
MAFLSILSMVQSTVVWVGLASGMVVCVWGVAHDELTVGDAVLFITIMNQLYVPLTYFGSYYRQVRCSAELCWAAQPCACNHIQTPSFCVLQPSCM